MLPVLINEHLIHLFNFHFEYQIQQGMRHGQELYRLVREFSPYDRLRAYQQACELIEQGAEVVISASNVRYAVWISLRSPSLPVRHPVVEPAAEICPLGI